jgi:hypothetical protein
VLVSKGTGHGTTGFEIVKKNKVSKLFRFNARLVDRRPRSIVYRVANVYRVTYFH